VNDNVNDNPLAITLPEEWQRECEYTVYCAGTLLRLARRRYAASAIVELLRTMPRTKEDMDMLLSTAVDAFSAKKGFSSHPSLYMRCVTEAFHFSEREFDLLGAVARHLTDFAKMPPERRAMLEASVIGTVTGCGMSG
jgi:hypothetical protein